MSWSSQRFIFFVPLPPVRLVMRPVHLVMRGRLTDSRAREKLGPPCGPRRSQDWLPTASIEIRVLHYSTMTLFFIDFRFQDCLTNLSSTPLIDLNELRSWQVATSHLFENQVLALDLVHLQMVIAPRFTSNGPIAGTHVPFQSLWVSQ